jgi:hypothetical protein
VTHQIRTPYIVKVFFDIFFPSAFLTQRNNQEQYQCQSGEWQHFNCGNDNVELSRYIHELRITSDVDFFKNILKLHENQFRWSHQIDLH